MGQAAYITIANATQESPTVTWPSMYCMYSDGDQGSDFRPITGTLGQILPAVVSGQQYIEAINSGTCFAVQSKFTLQLSFANDVDFLFYFTCQGGYLVNDTKYVSETSGDISVYVAIESGGGLGQQDQITVLVQNVNG